MGRNEKGDGADWETVRRRREKDHLKSSPGARVRRRSRFSRTAFALVGLALHGTGLFARGLANAKAIRLTNVELLFDNLPAAFDGYRIVQLSDLHVDALPQTTTAAAALLGPLSIDLCVLTGDYLDHRQTPFEQLAGPLSDLIAAAAPIDGVIGILGNHDRTGLAAALRGLGVRMLINESLALRRSGQTVTLTGTDDVHYFYTGQADRALVDSAGGFKVALVHSPELADVAARAGFDLYITGHTHGGQVCLPGGRPIITNLSKYRQYARGLWRHGAMVGYTSTGTGVSGLPVRFNCPGEVAVLTLRRTRNVS